MKPYIAAYKVGASAPSVAEDQLVYWYRPTPRDVSCSGDPLGPPNGRELLADVVFVTTLLTSPATLTITSGNKASVTINAPAGVLTWNATMGLGSQTFEVTRNGATILGGTSTLQITNSCVFYNYNAYVGSFNATGSGPPPTSSSGSTLPSSTQSQCCTNTKSTSVVPPTTSIPAPPTTKTTPPAPTSTSNPGSGSTCIAGTGPGNYVGLCNFSCKYGYCPPGPCTCTTYGVGIIAPPVTANPGYPLPGEDDSYLGLCSFCCSHGYCPPTACAQG
jgi:glucan endo-1,3-alpha-glucosidase